MSIKGRRRQNSGPGVRVRYAQAPKMCLPIGSERGTGTSGLKLDFPNPSSFRFLSAEVSVVQLVSSDS